MQVSEQSEAPQIVVCGEVDIESVDALREVGARACAGLPAGRRLDIDMAAVTFIDSSGLGSLIAMRKKVEATGSRIALINPSPAVVRVLELAGLRDSFDILSPAG